MPRLSTALATALLLLSPALSRGAELQLDYQVRWAGLPAASVALGLDEAGPGYRAHAEITTGGVVRVLTRFRAVAESHGPDPLAFLPIEGTGYEARYSLRGRDRRTVFVQARDDGAPLARRVAGDTSKRAELDARHRRGAFDPIAALVVLRARLADGGLREGMRFAIPIYDGRRRFDVEGVVPAESRITWNGESVPVRAFALMLKPRAGFSGAELDGEDDPEDVERPARLVISADARALPYAFEVTAAGLPLAVKLETVCSSGACKGTAQALDMRTASQATAR